MVTGGLAIAAGLAALLVAPRRLRRRRSEAFYAGAVSGGAMIGAGSNQTDESSSSSFALWAQSNGISRPWARFSSRRAADAYQVAIARLENSSYRNALAEFRRDHLRHITEFGDILSRMGRTPPKEGDMKALLTKGKVVIAGPMSDEAILQAMRTNEADTNTAYERAVNFKGLEANTRDVLQNGLADERRHCEWI
jgi:hypothetical protein